MPPTDEQEKIEVSNTDISMEVELLNFRSLCLSDSINKYRAGKTGAMNHESDDGYNSKSISDSIDKCRTSDSAWNTGVMNHEPDEEYTRKLTSDSAVNPGFEHNSIMPTLSSLDATQVFSPDQDGDTDLHIGIIQRKISLVLMFISTAPNSEWLNLVNHLLQTPLHLAVITKLPKIVRRLMTAGARVDVCDIHGNTPLHIACREGYDDIVQCLLQPVYYEETHLNKYEIPYQRIPQDLKRRNSDGHTCLHLAARSTHLKVLQVILNKGADVNVPDGTSGRTILHYACETGNRILLHFLLSQRNISISCRTFGGHTPLSLAAGRGYGDVVRVLLAHGADLTDIGEGDTDNVILQ